MSANKLNVLLISAEVAPFAKVGGLADVAGSLPKALAQSGHDVRVVMPCYPMIETDPAYASDVLLPALAVPIRTGVWEAACVRRTWIRRQPVGRSRGTKNAPKTGRKGDIPVYLVGSTPPGSRESLEAPRASGYFQAAVRSELIYTYAPEPYVFFCRAVLEMVRALPDGWKPDIVHCNDWHTGLIPLFARAYYSDDPVISSAGYVFTIHNLAYQGTFGREQWTATGLPESFYGIDGLEFYGQWSFLKGGLLYADRVNTVSPNYAREIQTPEYGCGLEGLLTSLSERSRLSGILNGIDTEEYDPATDGRIAASFSAEEPGGKALCKAALQTELGLPVLPRTPVLGIVSRLADQKGVDLIAAVADKMLEWPVQFVLLGTGDHAYELFFKALEERYPQQVRTRIGFDVNLAQRIYAGSDMFLMPSRFEPCGLGQMMSLRYGTAPVVRATGGLADTIRNFDPRRQPDGNGFVFQDYSPSALLAALDAALKTYRNTAQWQALVARALASDCSWTRSAASYTALYREAAMERRNVSSQKLPRPEALSGARP